MGTSMLAVVVRDVVIIMPGPALMGTAPVDYYN